MPTTESYTKTVESGAFIRTTIRKGKKRKIKTDRFTKNEKKVILGFIGDFEVYVYPYDYPDTIFIGQFPISTKIDSTNVQGILGVYNRMCWFLSGEAFSKPKRRKGANARRRSIVSAYNNGLNDQRSKEKPPF